MYFIHFDLFSAVTAPIDESSVENFRLGYNAYTMDLSNIRAYSALTIVMIEIHGIAEISSLLSVETKPLNHQYLDCDYINQLNRFSYTNVS